MLGSILMYVGIYIIIGGISVPILRPYLCKNVLRLSREHECEIEMVKKQFKYQIIFTWPSIYMQLLYAFTYGFLAEIYNWIFGDKDGQ
jgi:hypothetical protein